MILSSKTYVEVNLDVVFIFLLSFITHTIVLFEEEGEQSIGDFCLCTESGKPACANSKKHDLI